jgi:hypothetical protein
VGGQSAPGVSPAPANEETGAAAGAIENVSKFFLSIEYIFFQLKTSGEKKKRVILEGINSSLNK